MKRSIQALATLGVLTGSLLLWSCDTLSEPTRPDTSLSPSGHALFADAIGQRFVVVKLEESLGSVSTTIGVGGGRLTLGKHVLTVPSGAVDAPTVFTMGHVDAELLRVELSATRERYNDVGSAGFPVPLQLELSFENAQDLPDDVEDLIVVYFQGDGSVEEQVSTVDARGHKAIGRIPHFSDFGLAWPF